LPIIGFEAVFIIIYVPKLVFWFLLFEFEYDSVEVMNYAWVSIGWLPSDSESMANNEGINFFMPWTSHWEIYMRCKLEHVWI
jgi:hypothetical protein